jgi:hypothetical protein
VPAVDPARLAREIERAFEPEGEPSLLARRVADLLTLYAERARRAGGARADRLNVPRPVMASVGDAVASSAGRRGHTLEFAAALWSIALHETRILAAEALASCASREAADWAEARVTETADFAVLEHLARRGLSGYRAREPQQAMARVREWIGSRSGRLRELGLYSLFSLVEEGGSEDVRAVLSLLAAHPALGRGHDGRALARLLRALAERSPQETARYLVDGVRAGAAASSQIARQVLPLLTERQQRILEEALARGRASGTMPPSK